MSMDFEKAIVEAIVNSFFTAQPSYQDPNSGMMNYTPSAALSLSMQIFAAKKEEILEAVIECIDLEKLGNDIANQVVTELKDTPNTWSRYRPKQENMHKLIAEKVAERMAEEIMAKDPEKEKQG